MERLTFREHSKLYLDAAPIIYSVEEHPNYWPSLQQVWARLDEGAIKVITSELSLLETLVVPIRDQNTRLVEAYETLLTGFRVEMLPITDTVLRSAAKLRAEQNFKTADAIHCATALSSGCDILIANDAGFRRLANINVVILSDLLAE